MPATATMNAVKTGWSAAENLDAAVAELAVQIGQPNAELVVFFSTTRHDPDALARAMNDRFPGIAVGCA